MLYRIYDMCTHRAGLSPLEKEVTHVLALAELLIFQNSLLNHLLMNNNECLTSIMLAWDAYRGPRELKGKKGGREI